jgi:putative NIF3 family GTP cyclohydrolase 1 type 2
MDGELYRLDAKSGGLIMANPITAEGLMDRIQKNLGVPWQSQRADGISDGVFLGDPDTPVTGIVTTFTPTLDVLRRAVSSGKNTIICRETPFYSRGERQPLFYRNGPAPSKEVIEKDAVYRVKRDFIDQNKLVIIHFFDNWEARKTDGQLRGLAMALGWDKFHSRMKRNSEPYRPGDVYFVLPRVSLNDLARSIRDTLKIRGMRLIGNPQSQVSKVAVTHGLLLVADLEQILKEPGVDVVVGGEPVEWEAGPYFQDLVTAGQSKGLILVGDEASEEPGSGEVATWLKTFIDEVPIQWIPAGEPFRTLS